MTLSRADEIELEADAEMVFIAESRGHDKCVKVGCMVELEPMNNKDGFCSFHRPREVSNELHNG